MRRLLAFLLILAGPAAAHEYWIEPTDYAVAQDSIVAAALFNGQNFAGTEFPFLPKAFARFDLALGDRIQPVAGRLGDRPALQMAPLGDGLHVAIFETPGDKVEYTDFAKFTGFVEHKGFPGALQAHAARGLPETGFSEFYSRHSKALIAVGSGSGADRAFGLETEIVALANPYTDALGGLMPVRVLYQGAPRADAQIELFAKAPDGTVLVTLHRTDADGVAQLPVVAGHSYLVDAVVLREPAPALAAERGVVWETLWAALTFAVPQ
jgi:Domain of unknown function (DUF4198)